MKTKEDLTKEEFKLLQSIGMASMKSSIGETLSIDTALKIFNLCQDFFSQSSNGELTDELIDAKFPKIDNPTENELIRLNNYNNELRRNAAKWARDKIRTLPVGETNEITNEKWEELRTKYGKEVWNLVKPDCRQAVFTWFKNNITKIGSIPLPVEKKEPMSFEKFVRKYYPDANLGICINCNADKGLHKHDTMQCPRNGIEETREGVKQVWTVSTYSDIGVEVRQEYKGYLLGCHTNIVELTDEEIKQAFPMDDGKITNAFNQQQLAFQHGAQWARDYINKTK